MVGGKAMSKIKYNHYIIGYGNKPITAKIISWKFEERLDYSRVSWVIDINKCLMMYTVVRTNNGTYSGGGFKQHGELMRIIKEELRLNLKHQHGILK